MLRAPTLSCPFPPVPSVSHHRILATSRGRRAVTPWVHARPPSFSSWSFAKASHLLMGQTALKDTSCVWMAEGPWTTECYKLADRKTNPRSPLSLSFLSLRSVLTTRDGFEYTSALPIFFVLEERLDSTRLHNKFRSPELVASSMPCIRSMHLGVCLHTTTRFFYNSSSSVAALAPSLPVTNLTLVPNNGPAGCLQLSIRFRHSHLYSPPPPCQKSTRSSRLKTNQPEDHHQTAKNKHPPTHARRERDRERQADRQRDLVDNQSMHRILAAVGRFQFLSIIYRKKKRKDNNNSHAHPRTCPLHSA